MNIVKFTSISSSSAELENGYSIHSEHAQSCRESHYLDFRAADGLFGFPIDLDAEWFRRIPDYGIELIPADNRHPVRVPGYGFNNGCYGTDIQLEVRLGGKLVASFDISECQEIEG